MVKTLVPRPAYSWPVYFRGEKHRLYPNSTLPRAFFPSKKDGDVRVSPTPVHSSRSSSLYVNCCHSKTRVFHNQLFSTGRLTLDRRKIPVTRSGPEHGLPLCRQGLGVVEVSQRTVTHTEGRWQECWDKCGRGTVIHIYVSVEEVEDFGVRDW